MTYDPLSDVIDEELNIDENVIDNLTAFRNQPKLVNLPGVDTKLERERVSNILNALIDSILLGIKSNPTKLWVLSNFQNYLFIIQQEDTEAREHFGMEVEEIMDILGIESSDGLLSYYLGGL